MSNARLTKEAYEKLRLEILKPNLSKIVAALDEQRALAEVASIWIDLVDQFSKRSRENVEAKPDEIERVILSYLIGKGDYLIYKVRTENINLHPIGLDLETLEANLLFLKEHQRLIYEAMISDLEAKEISSVVNASQKIADLFHVRYQLEVAPAGTWVSLVGTRAEAAQHYLGLFYDLLAEARQERPALSEALFIKELDHRYSKYRKDQLAILKINSPVNFP